MRRSKKALRIAALFSLVALMCCNLISPQVHAVEAGGIPDRGIYTLRNVGSGKCLNVHGGTNANGTNVYQLSRKDTKNQLFVFDYDPANDWYRIYAFCSSNGNNRCIDIVKNGSSVENGCNVEIYTPTDDVAQTFVLDSVGPQTVVIRSYSNQGVVLATNGISDGSSGGRSAASSGNVFMKTYDEEDNYQKWELLPQLTELPLVEGIYQIKSAYSELYLSTSGTSIEQRMNTQANTQKWRLIYLENGYYELQPLITPTYRLTVCNGADTNGTNLQIAADANIPSQRFRIIPSGAGTYRIAAACSAKQALDVRGPSSNEYVPIQTWRYSGALQQRWYFQLLEEESSLPMGLDWVFDSSEPHLQITSGYRTFTRPDHFGMDLADSYISGDDILCPVSGTVEHVFDDDEDAGYGVVIRTPYVDSNGRPIFMGFIHMVANSVTVQKNDYVLACQPLGKVGNTPEEDDMAHHLHFSVWSGPNRYGVNYWADYLNCINPQRLYPDLAFTGQLSNVT